MHKRFQKTQSNIRCSHMRIKVFSIKLSCFRSNVCGVSCKLQQGKNAPYKIKNCNKKQKFKLTLCDKNVNPSSSARILTIFHRHPTNVTVDGNFTVEFTVLICLISSLNMKLKYAAPLPLQADLYHSWIFCCCFFQQELYSFICCRRSGIKCIFDLAIFLFGRIERDKRQWSASVVFIIMATFFFFYFRFSKVIYDFLSRKCGKSRDLCRFDFSLFPPPPHVLEIC